MTNPATILTVTASIKAPVHQVWEFWTKPEHITKWNSASSDWHTPRAENDLKPGGKFLSRMESVDGKMGFDFTGTYQKVEEHQLISYLMDDGRKVEIKFEEKGDSTFVTESFDAETQNSLELQQQGWQAILNNFKAYAESMMKIDKMTFEVLIKASPEKVYQAMLDDKSYRDWTSEFSPGSHYKGSWEKGSKILFIGPGENGVMGMVSRIEENIPSKFVSIKHLGLVENGVEVISGPSVEGWAGAFENYTFQEKDGMTLLKVELDSNEEFKGYFETTWPKALNRLKSLCES
jgi:uncharacterized protein YndB with AHSA1/START domain